VKSGDFPIFPVQVLSDGRLQIIPIKVTNPPAVISIGFHVYYRGAYILYTSEFPALLSVFSVLVSDLVSDDFSGDGF
jgi:hypothetical protein